MGTKRPHGDVQFEDGQASVPWKKARHITHSNKHNAKEGSSEWAKKRVRAIERLFNRGSDLPADVRNEMERELAAHKNTIADRSFQKKRSAMISKYHMVRFFDRKKAMRLVKQLERKIGDTQDTDETPVLRRQLHIAQVDEAYAQHHPHVEPYISLYGKSGDSKDGEQGTSAAMAALEAERPAMWTTVEKAMEQGEGALRQLRERRPPAGIKPAVPSSSQKSKSRPQTKATPEGKAAPEGKAMPESKAAQETARPAEQPAAHRPINSKGQPLNRRERRKIAREAPPDVNADDDDDGDFFTS